MKIYLSADIEGVTGTTVWDETEKSKPDYSEFQRQMTAEVAAACRGALAAGASEVWVKDAHDSARNLLAAELPVETRLLRGWSGHPYMMVDGLDSSFDALLMIGYHSRAGSIHSPLAHTMSGAPAYIKINGQYASEFMINTYTAALAGVPAVFVSGDAGLCADAAAFVPGITTVAVKQGVSTATINLHPRVAVEKIETGVQQALRGDLSRCRIELPKHFNVEIGYRAYDKAYAYSFYPGMKRLDDRTLAYESDDYFDLLRLFAFTL